MAALTGSTRSLSGSSVGPAQVSFSPSGRALIVTEKMTNLIDELRVDSQTGLITRSALIASSGQTPFGFSVTQSGQVIVSEAFGGADNASAVSSYQLGRSAGLNPVSRSVPDTESAACWVVLVQNDRLAFTTNTKTGSVSAYSVGSQGELRLLAARAADTGAGSKPTDLATSRQDRYMYVLVSGTASIGALRIDADGALTPVSTLGGLPPNATGLAAF